MVYHIDVSNNYRPLVEKQSSVVVSKGVMLSRGSAMHASSIILAPSYIVSKVSVSVVQLWMIFAFLNHEFGSFHRIMNDCWQVRTSINKPANVDNSRENEISIIYLMYENSVREACIYWVSNVHSACMLS